jgi:hypothetical protein
LRENKLRIRTGKEESVTEKVKMEERENESRKEKATFYTNRAKLDGQKKFVWTNIDIAQEGKKYHFLK